MQPDILDGNASVVANLQQKIDRVRSKLSLINNQFDLEYSGNRIDDVLLAVSIDEKRDYLESRLLELETLLSDVTSVNTNSKAQKVNAGLGVTEGDLVQVEREKDGKTFNFRIACNVSYISGVKCLSTSSPLGKSLLGKVPGESVNVVSPSGNLKYKVIKIER